MFMKILIVIKVEHFLRKYKILEIEKISTKIYAYEPINDVM